jgi:hypothetical protein
MEKKNNLKDFRLRNLAVSKFGEILSYISVFKRPKLNFPCFSELFEHSLQYKSRLHASRSYCGHLSFVGPGEPEPSDSGVNTHNKLPVRSPPSNSGVSIHNKLPVGSRPCTSEIRNK